MVQAPGGHESVRLSISLSVCVSVFEIKWLQIEGKMQMITLSKQFIFFVTYKLAQ
jgi:hypothetical protein